MEGCIIFIEEIAKQLHNAFQITTLSQLHKQFYQQKTIFCSMIKPCSMGLWQYISCSTTILYLGI